MVWSARKFVANILLVTIAGSFFSFSTVQAALIVLASDTMSDPVITNASNHDISFISPTGVDASGDTITLTFTSFSLGFVDFADIDMTHGTGTGSETSEALAAAPAAGVWGVGVAGDAITFTAPTDAVAGEIAVSSTIIFLIGTNAAGGVDQITNPVTAGSYFISVGGTFGDTGSIGVAIVLDNEVVVTGIVPGPPGGGGGGGGPPQDSTPPTIFNVQASSTSFTTATITWQTDESSTSIVDFGHDLSYASGTVSNSSLVLVHTIDLSGLIPCTTYFFKVTSADSIGNSASSGGYSFTMPCDTVAPVISNVQAVNITDSSVIIIWDTDEPADSLVEYGLTTGYGGTGFSGSFVTGHSIPIAGLNPNTTYHFRVTSSDPSGNTTTSGDFTFTTLPDTTPPANVTLTATPGDGQVQLTWTIPTDPDFSGTRIVRRDDQFPTGPFDGTLVYLGNGTSHLDLGLTNGTTYYYGAYAFDTNGNFASGALDSAIPTGPPPPPTPTPTTTPPTPTTTPPLPPPTIPPAIPPPTGGVTTTPPTPGATITFNLYGAEGTLILGKDSLGYTGVAANNSILVVAPLSGMNGVPTMVVFVIGDATYNLTFDPSTNSYTGIIPTPGVGVFGAKGQAIFDDGRVAEQAFVLNSQGGGQVLERPLVGAPSTPVPGASVTLFRLEGGVWVPWNGSAYGQSNIVITGPNGGYVFQVPPGTYQVVVEQEGYDPYTSSPILVDSNVFNRAVLLIKTPPPILPTEAPTGTPIDVVTEVIQNLGEQAAYQIKQVQEILESEVIQEATQNVAAPAAATVAILNAASALSLFNVLSYLQYLFTQPILFFARRRRKKFGVVYNALSKQPVDLAIVRLIHTETGLTVQSRVTDKLGRYLFQAQPGQYKIEVTKPNYLFPSQYLRGKTVDVDYVDLYTGDVIRVEESTVLALNIPMDPVVPDETPAQVIFRSTLRKLQHVIALSGVIISAIILLISPTIPMGLFALAQVFVYLLFRRLSLPPKPKGWGIVLESRKRKPLQRAIVRIFDSKFNKLLETQLTDKHGRYGFLVGKSVYYITGEAPGYERSRMPDLDLTKREGAVVDQNIILSKGGQAGEATGVAKVTPRPIMMAGEPPKAPTQVIGSAPKSELIRTSPGSEASSLQAGGGGAKPTAPKTPNNVKGGKPN